MNKEKTIGILTGGGDVPGLNPLIKELTEEAEEEGWNVLGIHSGWKGLVNINEGIVRRSRYIEPLSRNKTRTIYRTGGTFLHTSRTNPQRVKESDMPDFLKSNYSSNGDGTFDCTDHVLEVINRLGINVLVPIGGDDTLSYAVRLHREGVPVVEIPKTMDKDVYGTEWTIGAHTAVTNGVNAVEMLRAPTGSHERIGIVELFGRDCGETALITGFLAYADRVVISEVPFDVEKLAKFLAKDRRNNRSNYAILVISEGASMIGGQIIEGGPADAYGHQKLGGIGKITGDAIHRITGMEINNLEPSYLVRGGPADLVDRRLARVFGSLAIQQINQGNTGIMLAVDDRGVFTTVPAETPVLGQKRVDVARFYDSELYIPKMDYMLGMPMMSFG